VPSKGSDRVVVYGGIPDTETARFGTNHVFSSHLFTACEGVLLDRTVVHLLLQFLAQVVVN
jgi:hypothetical protein